MIKSQDFPEEFDDLADVEVSLPKMEDDSPALCPVKMQEILDYLNIEAPGGVDSGSDEVIEFELKFLRTAVVNETSYWIWSFIDAYDTECYVTVAKNNNTKQSCLGYDESFGLTPEQFIIADYFEFD